MFMLFNEEENEKVSVPKNKDKSIQTVSKWSLLLCESKIFANDFYEFRDEIIFQTQGGVLNKKNILSIRAPLVDYTLFFITVV